MGCRGTIEIWHHASAPVESERPVVLYTHWGAKSMLSDLKTTLKRKKRWNDAPYLARMIFCQMMGDYTRGTTGYGIMTENALDTEEELLVDVDRQEVIRKRMGHDNETFTFEELIND